MEKKQEKKKIAVALEYVPGEDAPAVVATGKGFLADKIIKEAGQSNVPIYEDAKLAKTLSQLELGDMIPPELYSVIAEILVYVDRMDRLKEKMMKAK